MKITVTINDKTAHKLVLYIQLSDDLKNLEFASLSEWENKRPFIF